MSPITVSDDRKGVPASTGHARASASRVASTPCTAAVIRDVSACEKSSATDEKILAALATLSDCIEKMETSHMWNDEDERIRGAIESGIFASALGAHMDARTTTVDVLRNSPERKPAAFQAQAQEPSTEFVEFLFSSLVTRSLITSIM